MHYCLVLAVRKKSSGHTGLRCIRKPKPTDATHATHATTAAAAGTAAVMPLPPPLLALLPLMSMLPLLRAHTHARTGAYPVKGLHAQMAALRAKEKKEPPTRPNVRAKIIHLPAVPISTVVT